jgi:hypothetical protein
MSRVETGGVEFRYFCLTVLTFDYGSILEIRVTP